MTDKKGKFLVTLTFDEDLTTEEIQKLKRKINDFLEEIGDCENRIIGVEVDYVQPEKKRYEAILETYCIVLKNTYTFYENERHVILAENEAEAKEQINKIIDDYQSVFWQKMRLVKLELVTMQKSPNWDERKHQRKFSLDKMYNEGYPKESYMGDGRVYEILTNRGELFEAIFDTSTRYRSEGVYWRRIEDREIFYRENVVAWRQIR